MVVLDVPWWKKTLETNYVRADAKRWFEPGALNSLTGYPTGISEVYVPRDQIRARAAR